MEEPASPSHLLVSTSEGGDSKEPLESDVIARAFVQSSRLASATSLKSRLLNSYEV